MNTLSSTYEHSWRSLKGVLKSPTVPLTERHTCSITPSTCSVSFGARHFYPVSPTLIFHRGYTYSCGVAMYNVERDSLEACSIDTGTSEFAYYVIKCAVDPQVERYWAFPAIFRRRFKEDSIYSVVEEVDASTILWDNMYDCCGDVDEDIKAFMSRLNEDFYNGETDRKMVEQFVRKQILQRS